MQQARGKKDARFVAPIEDMRCMVVGGIVQHERNLHSLVCASCIICVKQFPLCPGGHATISRAVIANLVSCTSVDGQILAR